MAFPLAAALARRIPQLRGQGARRMLWAAATLAGLVALTLMLVGGPDPTDTLNPFHLGDFSHVLGE